MRVQAERVLPLDDMADAGTFDADVGAEVFGRRAPKADFRLRLDMSGVPGGWRGVIWWDSSRGESMCGGSQR